MRGRCRLASGEQGTKDRGGERTDQYRTSIERVEILHSSLFALADGLWL